MSKYSIKFNNIDVKIFQKYYGQSLISRMLCTECTKTFPK